MRKTLLLCGLLVLFSGCAKPSEVLVGRVESLGRNTMRVRLSPSQPFSIAEVSFDQVDAAIQAQDLVEIRYDGAGTTSEPVQLRANQIKQLLDFSQAPRYRTISLAYAKVLMELDAVVVIDVRPPDSYEASHLPNAINVPLPHLATQIADIVADKNQAIMVYCQSISASKEAAIALVELGYRNVFDFGSIYDWSK